MEFETQFSHWNNKCCSSWVLSLNRLIAVTLKFEMMFDLLFALASYKLQSWILLTLFFCVMILVKVSEILSNFGSSFQKGKDFFYEWTTKTLPVPHSVSKYYATNLIHNSRWMMHIALQWQICDRGFRGQIKHSSARCLLLLPKQGQACRALFWEIHYPGCRMTTNRNSQVCNQTFVRAAREDLPH